MSAGDIDDLLEFWAAQSVSASSDPDGAPFRDAQDLYNTIDSIEHGDAPWESFEAWNKSTTIAEADQATHRSMLVPIILGTDKTTVSVATGQNDFHPVYMLLGNVHNSVRRAHRDALLPIAFLAIPKACRKEEDTDEFQIFQKQVYHASLAKILSPLRAAMTTPEVVWCPDGHYRCAIYELGPFIADYPEQVVLAGIVQGWCPRCRATPEQLGGLGEPQFEAHTDVLIDGFDPGWAWTTYGIDVNVTDRIRPDDTTPMHPMRTFLGLRDIRFDAELLLHHLGLTTLHIPGISTILSGSSYLDDPSPRYTATSHSDDPILRDLQNTYITLHTIAYRLLHLMSVLLC
ncbi:hypothetical protein JAAARDRAFT_195807 [Jaapia argillacea MUCL 33604]|uniref:Uncharacterized protein n=1 Tax=Jaapia argillacea MUCL 33604 TaxID=933084 RepID=A0A067PKN8_9AGAM|nr:hypothetical protein JAAARDRAFT_195807 [Jaapia argillacea MUCL 33604]